MNNLLSLSDPVRAAALARTIARLTPDYPVKIVHVCGTHEATITEHGLRRFLPEPVEVLEGPGCPVCVTPTRDIDAAVKIARKGAILCTFGDMTRVPGTEMTLAAARADGADVRVVLSAAEAASIARNTNREVVFFGVGFETTTPMTAAILLDDPPENLSVIVSHKLIPPAMAALLDLPDNRISAYLAPGHVSVIIGEEPYTPFPRDYGIPVVIGGFEPLDILYAIALILRQLKDGTPRVENGYPRAVRPEGNRRAQELIEQVFEPTDVVWRGIGSIPNSGLRLRDEFRQFDARARFGVTGEEGEETVPGCRCPDVLTARAVPTDCPLFRTTCTPLNPVGPCMVGVEAACNIWYRYGGRPKL